MLKAEFGVRFCEVYVNAKEICLFQNPFVADIDEFQPFYQFELAKLQNCDENKKQKTRNEDVQSFWQHVYLRANLFAHETAENSYEIKIDR